MNISRIKLAIEAVASLQEGETLNMFRYRDACGTTACIVGWYCLRNPEADLWLMPTVAGSFYAALRSDPVVRTEDAVSAHFDMPLEMVQDIFYDTADAEAAMEKLRQVIADA